MVLARCEKECNAGRRFGASIDQSFQYEFVQALAARDGDGIFYRSACKLVAESNRLALVPQHSGADCFFERLRIAADGVTEQPHFSSRRDDRHEF